MWNCIAPFFTFMRECRAEVWQSDCWQAQLNAPRRHAPTLSATSDLQSATSQSMGSFRSDWRPRAYAALATVINTTKRRGENVF